MKNNKSENNKSDTSVVKNNYYISLKNAGKRTQGNSGHRFEGHITGNKYYGHLI